MAGIPGEIKRGKDVSDLKAKFILQPALTSHFSVVVSGPPGEAWKTYLNDNQLSVNSENLNLSCTEASLPGSSLATHELNNDRTGVTERHVYRRLHDDRIDLTFYIDAVNYTSVRFFEVWIKYIVNEVKNPQSGYPGVADEQFFYRVKYPSKYYGTLQVIKYERDYTRGLKYTFVNPYPISINSIPVSYDASSLLKCTVSFTYSRYYLESYQIAQSEDSRDNPNSPANPENTPQTPLSPTGVRGADALFERTRQLIETAPTRGINSQSFSNLTGREAGRIE